MIMKISRFRRFGDKNRNKLETPVDEESYSKALTNYIGKGLYPRLANRDYLAPPDVSTAIGTIIGYDDIHITCDIQNQYADIISNMNCPVIVFSIMATVGEIILTSRIHMAEVIEYRTAMALEEPVTISDIAEE